MGKKIPQNSQRLNISYAPCYPEVTTVLIMILWYLNVCTQPHIYTHINDAFLEAANDLWIIIKLYICIKSQNAHFTKLLAYSAAYFNVIYYESFCIIHFSLNISFQSCLHRMNHSIFSSFFLVKGDFFVHSLCPWLCS